MPAPSSLLPFAAGIFCLLAGVYIGIVPATGAGTEDFTQVTFYNDTSSAYDNNADHIDTVALWNKQQLAVLPKQDGDVKHYEEMSQLLAVAVEGDVLEDATFTGWSAPINEVYEGKEPMRLFVVSGLTARFIEPDITVTFTNEWGPSDSIMGKSSLKGVKTSGGARLTSADITIFRADDLYGRGVLLPAVLHELGHALGLQHSTSEDGIMYPMIMYKEDGTPNDRIGECEFAGLRTLYVDSVIQRVPC